MVPCGVSNGTICQRASKLETNGKGFCEAVGFSVVQGADDQAEEPCYGSNSVVVTVVPVVKSLMKTVWFQDLKYRMVILNLLMCRLTSLIFLASTLLNRFTSLSLSLASFCLNINIISLLTKLIYESCFGF